MNISIRNLTRLVVFTLAIIISIEPVSAQKPVARSTKKIVIRKVDKSTGAVNRPVIPTQDMNKPREEPVFLTLEVISDKSGTLWLNDKSYSLKQDSVTIIPVPVSISFYYISEDTLFITKQERISFQKYQEGSVYKLSLENEDNYRQLLLKLSLQSTEDELMEQITGDMLPFSEDARIEMGRYEVSIGEYAAYIRLKESEEKTTQSAQAIDSSQVMSSIPTRYIWSFRKGVDWRCDVFGEKIPDNQFDLPVVNVSWKEAVAFCDWLSTKDPYYKYRLPTAQEWEQAAYSGFLYDFPWGADTTATDRYANTADLSLLIEYQNARKFPELPDRNLNDRYPYTSPTGSYLPNESGFYDLAGNVREWCIDDYYDQTGSKYVKKKVKGGSFCYTHERCSYAKTEGWFPDKRRGDIGFRICRELKITSK